MDRTSTRMADVGEKEISRREAIAQARVRLRPQTVKIIKAGKIPKGDVLTLAECSGLMAAKKVSELIPLCHQLPLEYAGVDFELKSDSVVITATCRAQSKTGVEMEAMTACAVSALTIYDMCKAIDRGAIIEEIKLLKKSGGKSGTYVRNSKNN